MQMNAQSDDGEKTVKFAESVSLAENGPVITFLAVVSDSRCPTGVDCFHAGNAVVRVKIKLPGDSEPQIHEFDTNRNDEEFAFGEYQLKLIALDPYPKDGVEIKPEDYTLRLSVAKTKQ